MLGNIIGAITFSGSLIAFGKLSGKIGGNPVLLPARHVLNLVLLIITYYLGQLFVDQAMTGGGVMPMVVMTLIALLFGVHMVMAIGGADMPVVVSMLNSYSGWAAASIGFMLGNDLKTGALVEVLPGQIQSPNPREQIQAVYYRNSTLSPRISAFVEFLATRLTL